MTTAPNQPQAASKQPPQGYNILVTPCFREAGDLTWTAAGWIVSNLTTGQHPAASHVARKAGFSYAALDKNDPKIHAPLRMMKEPEWLAHSTPLFYILNNPCAPTNTEEVVVFQLHEIRAAVQQLKHDDTHVGTLSIVYLDHRIGEYDIHALMWTEYEDDPKNPGQKARKIVDPNQLFIGFFSQ